MINLLHFFIKILISLYKWIELQFLMTLITPYAEFHTKKIFREINIDILIRPSNAIKSSEIESKVSAKESQNTKYDKLILHCNDERIFTKIANRGYIAFGESYMNGELTCSKDENDITELMTRYLSNNYYKTFYTFWNSLLHKLEFESVNLQTTSKAWEVGRKHYDLGNTFFRSFLDKNMQYSCGYWANADNLNDAQINKIELIARKLDLRPGMKVLDLGCGWGTLCKYLAENYGVECVGVTVSEEGYRYAKQVCSDLPVEILLEDYRQINQKFDRIFSIEMFEHVGFKNYKDFFGVVYRCLNDDGIFLLHTTVITDSTIKRVEPFIHTYVFPNMSIAYPYEIFNAIDGMFVVEDWHNMALDMSKTCIAWRENFIKNWPTIRDQYDDQVYRMWTYFTSVIAASYKTKKSQLVHIVLTKAAFPYRYKAER